MRRTEADLAKRRAYARRQREERDAEDRRVRAWKEREERSPAASLAHGRVRSTLRPEWHLVAAAPGTEAPRSTLCSVTTAGGWGRVVPAGEAAGPLCWRCAREAVWRQEREEKDQRDDATPHYAVCKLGPRRFCWAAWPAGVVMIDPAAAHGYAPDEETATTAAIEAAGPGAYPAAPHPKGYARWPHEQRLLTERAAKRADGHDSARLELLWTAHWHESDDWLQPPRLAVDAWRVVKRTPRRVYVDRERHDPARRSSGTIWDYDVRTHVLDRAHLEREGWAERAGASWWERRYFLRREDAVAAAGDRSAHPGPAASAGAPVPDCLRVLGLARPCTRQQVERAYRRRARAVHPDAGGEHAAFLALRRAYEAALRLVAPTTVAV